MIFLHSLGKDYASDICYFYFTFKNSQKRVIPSLLLQVPVRARCLQPPPFEMLSASSLPGPFPRGIKPGRRAMLDNRRASPSGWLFPEFESLHAKALSIGVCHHGDLGLFSPRRPRSQPIRRVCSGTRALRLHGSGQILWP